MLKTSQEFLMFPAHKRGLIVEEDVVVRLSDWLSCEARQFWGGQIYTPLD